MSYKIYYDEIWEVTSKSAKKCKTWLEKFGTLSEKIQTLIDDENFKGEAADNIKNYMSEVHCVLIAIIGSILQAHSVKAASYYSGYLNRVDSGVGDDCERGRTVILYDEVNSTNGSIRTKLNKILDMASNVKSDANAVKNSISDLVTISSYPKFTDLEDSINLAIYIADIVHTRAVNYESSRANDFVEIDNLITQALSIIKCQIGNTRTPIDAYQKGGIASMCDIESVFADLETTSAYVEEFYNSDEYEEAYYLAFNREALLQAEAEENRQWANWIAVGVAIVASVAFVAAMAIGAAPLVCAGISALGSAGSTLTSGLVTNYIKTGSAVDGLDKSELIKKTLISGATGFITGYAGATASLGSAIMQPMEYATRSAVTSMLSESVEGLIDMTWDVGEALVTGTPGDEIMSILEDDATDMFSGIASEGAAAFVGGFVGGSFSINAGDKGYLRKVGEAFVESFMENGTKGVVNTVLDLGDVADGSKTFFEVLKENSKETVSAIAGDSAKAMISSGFSDKIDGIKNDYGKVATKTIQDTAADTAETIAKGISKRDLDYVYGDRTDTSNIYKEVWEEDLDSGRNIVKSAGESAGKHYFEDIKFADKKTYNYAKSRDYDKDGKIDVVQYDDYAVTKEDYDAAVRNANKGAYKGKSAKEILGLSDDTKLSSGKERSISIERLEKSESKAETNANKLHITREKRSTTIAKEKASKK